MALHGTALATRSLPPSNADGESDSGITWPPVEKLELVWFEKSAPPEDVAENFRLVPLNDLSARPGVPAEPPAAVEPAEAPEAEPIDAEPIEPFESWAPGTSVTLVAAPVTAVERSPAIDQFRFAPPDPVVARVPVAQWALTGALAVCAMGLLLATVGVWWRWSAGPVQMTQAPAAAAVDTPVARPAKPAVASSAPVRPAPAAPLTVPDQQTPPTAAATSQPPAPEPAARIAAKAETTPDRPVAPVIAPEPARKPAKPPAPPPVAPPPETALASVTPQPLTPQTTLGAPIAIEEPPPRPASRARPSAPTNAPVASAVVSPPSDEQRIRAVLHSYQAAFAQLDQDAVQAVWPSVDAKALGRAFDGLSSQSIVFDRCDVSVAAAAARAACHGDVEYVKRVGGGGTQSARRQWIFDLQKSSDGAWRIQSLTSR